MSDLSLTERTLWKERDMGGMEAAPLRAMLQTLDRTDRLVLILFYAEKLTSVEIGLVLEMPSPRVEATLVRLKERCRRAVNALQPAQSAQPVAV